RASGAALRDSGRRRQSRAPLWCGEREVVFVLPQVKPAKPSRASRASSKRHARDVRTELLLLGRIDWPWTRRVCRLVETFPRHGRGVHLDRGVITRVGEMDGTAGVAGDDHPLGSRNRNQIFGTDDAADELDVTGRFAPA